MTAPMLGYYRPATDLSAADTKHATLGNGESLAVETMLRLVRSSHAYDPIGVYVPWAKQHGGVTWQTIADSDHDVIAYRICAADVARVNAYSYGSELPWVGVLANEPTDRKIADAAFDATRYDLFEVEAVYDADDKRPTPRIHFLYWAKLHEDVGGGRESLDAVAKRLGGVLVFPMHLTVDGPRQAPPLPFMLALSAQLAMPAANASAGVGEAGTMVTAPPPPTHPTAGQMLAWTAALGTAGVILWKTVRGPKRRRSG